MKNKETSLHDKAKQMAFLRQSGEWKKTMSRITQEILNEHRKLLEEPIKDFSTAVLYQEYLLTTIQFLNMAQETLDEYVLERLGANGFFDDFVQNRNKAQEQS